MPAQRVAVREIVVVYGSNDVSDRPYLERLAGAMPPGVILIAVPDGMTLASLDEQEMKKHGWYRHKKAEVANGATEGTSSG